MVECKPYNCRLMRSACVDRWRKAQGVSLSGEGMGAGNAAIRNGARRSVLRECMTCCVGRERAGEGLDGR